MFDEIPVVVNNSKLVDILLNDIDESKTSYGRKAQPTAINLTPAINPDSSSSSMFVGLDLSMASSLEQQLRSVLLGLETLNDFQYIYQRSLSKYQGQTKIPAEQRNRELAPIRLDMALISAQLNLYCGGLSQMTGQTVGKLMLTQAVHRSRQS
ncbi:unnamed protein product [Protopolystoma xenopodis]|uniref:eIF3h C-terminal domain-containing protein n=1 Tax=Protopolystoma xenopodis TaxID=117903 RepID=A0A3S5AVH2_9PLAT|nr:unnamed protein product [Protopolystoma xenopodis]